MTMIDRQVLHNPNKDFDFFNDFKDTRSWLKKMSVLEIKMEKKFVRTAIDVLESRYEDYKKNHPIFGKTK